MKSLSRVFNIVRFHPASRGPAGITRPGHREPGKAALWEPAGRAGRATLIFRDRSYRKGAEKEE